MVHAGAYHDPVNLNGLAHFTEHAITSCHGKTSDLLKRFELNGGEAFLGETDFYFSKFSFRSPLSCFVKNLNFFAKVILKSHFDDEMIKKEKSIILNEFYEKFNNAEEYRKERKYSATLFKDVEPIFAKNKSLLGTPSVIKKIKTKDVQNYYRQYYDPINISLVFIGNLSKKKLLEEIIASAFGRDSRQKKALLPEVLNLTKIKTLRHTQIYRCFCNYGTIQINNLLPGNFEKEEMVVFERLLYYILFEKIREEKRAAYQVSVEIINRLFAYESTIHIPSFDLSLNIEKTIKKSIAEINKHETEFKKCKRIIINAFKFFEHTPSSILTDVLKILSENNRLSKNQLFINKIKKVRFETMIEIAKWYQKRSYTIIHLPQ